MKSPGLQLSLAAICLLLAYAGALAHGAPTPAPRRPAISANATLARKAYPFCKINAKATSFFLDPSATFVQDIKARVRNGKSYKEYTFTIVEDYASCVNEVRRRGRNNTSLCGHPLEAVMLTVSKKCHQSIDHTNSVDMLLRVQGTNVDVPMLAHAHKGHDTGVPLLKYRVKPMLQPKKTLPYRVLRIAVKLRIQQVAIHAHCPDLPSLCGGPRCMVALSDYEYDNCPAYLMNV